MLFDFLFKPNVEKLKAKRDVDMAISLDPVFVHGGIVGVYFS